MTKPDPAPAAAGEDEPWRRYRLAAQADERHREGHRDPGTSPFEEPQQQPPRGSLARFRDKTGLSGGELALVLLSIAGLLTSVFYLFRDSGVGHAGLFILLATLPLALVVWVLLRADRVAHLPARYLVFAVLWGAGVATAVAAVVNSALYSDFLAYLGDTTMAETLAAVAVAPVSEEALKGAGAILLLLMARRYVVTLANGIAVGGLVGAGFAFTENLIYFADAHTESTAVLGVTIFGRAVMSPFVHPLATSLTAIGFTAAVLAGKRAWGWIWRMSLGFTAAMAVHALWNGLASIGTMWLLAYFVIEVPLFTIWLVWILRRPRAEMPNLRKGLQPYAATGWIGAEELATLTDLRARRHAKRWARKTSRLARKCMRRYLVDGGRLGLEQVVLERLGPTPARAMVARKSLSELISNRTLFLEQGEMAQQASELAHFQPGDAHD